jgi:hypothetical protein
MTDLQLLDKFVSQPFPDPKLFREIRNRGLYGIIQYAPPGKEGKAYIRAKLIEKGYPQDPEMQQIKSIVDRLKHLQAEIAQANVTSPRAYIALLKEMETEATNLINYFK